MYGVNDARDRGGWIVSESDAAPSDDEVPERPIPGIDVEEVLLRFARFTGAQVWSLQGPDWKWELLEDDATEEEIRADDEARRQRRLARRAPLRDPDSESPS